MSGIDVTIEMLRRGAGREPLDPAEWKRVKARFAWVGEMLAALHDAQDRMHERCRAAVDRVPEAEFRAHLRRGAGEGRCAHGRAEGGRRSG